MDVLVILEVGQQRSETVLDSLDRIWYERGAFLHSLRACTDEQLGNK